MNKPTTERDQRIAAERRTGRTYVELAAAHGISADAVRLACRRAGLLCNGPVRRVGRTGQKDNAARDAKIAALRADGLTYAQIAERFGISQQAASDACTGRNRGRRR